ncbi:MAG: SSI family serine proteinase inhibitor [Sporichthyaceae bacterium]
MRTTFVAAAIGLAAVATVVPATAASAHHDNRTNLTLTVKERGGDTYRVTLKCNPTGGSHPDRSDACREIGRAKGDLRYLPGRQTFRACPKIYRPVTVTAKGKTHGWNIYYKETFSNWCEMTTETGSVFDFGDRDRGR